MYFLIVTLCVVGVTGTQENLISLRDYDFVGEDKRLTSLLAERMALLQEPIDLSDVEARIAQEQSINFTGVPPNFIPKPDHFQVELKRYPKFNVSMDYGEMFNASLEMKEPLLYPDSGLPFNITEAEDDARRRPGNLTADRRTGNLTAGRRAPSYWDPSYWHYDVKLVDLMRQNIYMVQNRFLEIQPIVEKYQTDDRFKIAYLFNRLDEWKKDIRTAFYAMSRQREWYARMHFRQQLLYYEHLLRKDIDVTYSIEFLNHLHGSFMTKMKELIPSRSQKDMMLKTKPSQLGPRPG